MYSLLLGYHSSQTFLVDNARECKCVYTHVYSCFYAYYVYISLYIENHEFLPIILIPVQHPTFQSSVLPFPTVRNTAALGLKYPVTAFPPNPQMPSSSSLDSDTCARPHHCADVLLIQRGFRHPPTLH